MATTSCAAVPFRKSADQVRSSWAPSSTRATSRMRTGVPPRVPSTISPNCSAEVTRPRLRVLLCDDWRKSVAWQPINGSRNFFSDVLSGTFDVALEHKCTGDIGKTFEGINADLIDATDRGDGILEWQDDSGDNFFGSCP